MSKHTFEVNDKSFSIILDDEHITITITRQLTVYDIEALEAELEEVSLWVMATDAYERATQRFGTMATLPGTTAADVKSLSESIVKLSEDMTDDR